MARKKIKKTSRALADLKSALRFYDDSHGDEQSAFLAVSKAFEVSVEYGWKDLKKKLEDKGVEDAYAPKDVIRKAAQVGLIDDAECWLDYIDARNDSVHDYYGMTQSEYITLARAYYKDAKKVLD